MADRRPDDLASLAARIKDAQGGQAAGSAGGGRGRASLAGGGFALRAGTELVACFATGAGIGLLLDHWLGTAPWLLGLFLLLGGAAGIMTVMRLAGRLAAAPWDGGIEKTNVTKDE